MGGMDISSLNLTITCYTETEQDGIVRSELIPVQGNIEHEITVNATATNDNVCSVYARICHLLGCSGMGLLAWNVGFNSQTNADIVGFHRPTHINLAVSSIPEPAKASPLTTDLRWYHVISQFTLDTMPKDAIPFETSSTNENVEIVQGNTNISYGSNVSMVTLSVFGAGDIPYKLERRHCYNSICGDWQDILLLSAMHTPGNPGGLDTDTSPTVRVGGVGGTIRVSWTKPQYWGYQSISRGRGYRVNVYLLTSDRLTSDRLTSKSDNDEMTVSNSTNSTSDDSETSDGSSFSVKYSCPSSHCRYINSVDSFDYETTDARKLNPKTSLDVEDLLASETYAFSVRSLNGFTAGEETTISFASPISPIAMVPTVPDPPIVLRVRPEDAILRFKLPKFRGALIDSCTILIAHVAECGAYATRFDLYTSLYQKFDSASLSLSSGSEQLNEMIRLSPSNNVDEKTTDGVTNADHKEREYVFELTKLKDKQKHAVKILCTNSVGDGLPSTMGICDAQNMDAASSSTCSTAANNLNTDTALNTIDSLVFRTPEVNKFRDTSVSTGNDTFCVQDLTVTCHSITQGIKSTPFEDLQLTVSPGIYGTRQTSEIFPIVFQYKYTSIYSADPSNPNQTVIDCGGLVCFDFTVVEGKQGQGFFPPKRIQGFKIINGNAGIDGGGAIYAPTVIPEIIVIEDCIFSGHRAIIGNAIGGALYFFRAGNLHISRTMFFKQHSRHGRWCHTS